MAVDAPNAGEGAPAGPSSTDHLASHSTGAAAQSSYGLMDEVGGGESPLLEGGKQTSLADSHPSMNAEQSTVRDEPG